MKTIETTAPPGTLNQNEILRMIYERRAVRKYKDLAVDRKDIEAIVDAGRMAPSAINRQPWRFYVVDKKEDIAGLEKEVLKSAAKGILKSGFKTIIKSATRSLHLAHGIDFLKNKNPIFHGAPVVVFLTAPEDNEWACLDLGMCAQNMMLAAKSMGLDSCPIGLGKYVQGTKGYAKLKIPEKEKVMLALIFGYGDEKPSVHDRIRTNLFYPDLDAACGDCETAE
ncbi:MAG TPA: nitroreductase family protein [Saprospiraceae bacterium]|nr:nitroreductase family protein [Saprospiraceae bacterium]HNT20089.1 nitroreductase family protein [Saprospiraceae bacterium]